MQPKSQPNKKSKNYKENSKRRKDKFYKVLFILTFGCRFLLELRFQDKFKEQQKIKLDLQHELQQANKLLELVQGIGTYNNLQFIILYRFGIQLTY